MGLDSLRFMLPWNFLQMFTPSVTVGCFLGLGTILSDLHSEKQETKKNLVWVCSMDSRELRLKDKGPDRRLYNQ